MLHPTQNEISPQQVTAPTATCAVGCYFNNTLLKRDGPDQARLTRWRVGEGGSAAMPQIDFRQPRQPPPEAGTPLPPTPTGGCRVGQASPPFPHPMPRPPQPDPPPLPLHRPLRPPLRGRPGRRRHVQPPRPLAAALPPGGPAGRAGGLLHRDAGVRGAGQRRTGGCHPPRQRTCNKCGFDSPCEPFLGSFFFTHG